MTSDPNDRSGSDDDRDPDDGLTPETESLPEDERVDDSTWSSFVDNITWHTSPSPDIPPDEVREALDDEEWIAPEPEPIGWRTTSPSLVLGLFGALGGAFALFIIAIFLRPVPGWILLVTIAVTVGSAAVLFTHLPQRRDPFSDGREV